jgi:hypothetical protein
MSTFEIDVARRRRAEHHAVVGLCLAAREHQMLGVPSVYRQAKHRRFSSRLAPAASGAAGADDGYYFGRCGGIEPLLEEVAGGGLFDLRKETQSQDAIESQRHGEYPIILCDSVTLWRMLRVSRTRTGRGTRTA